VTFGETQLAKDPGHAKWWYEFLGSAYAATGQNDKAAEAFKKERASPDPPESCP
jgi:cytochrome c-type biogenesis protein CcmH/NrfG